MNKLEIFLKRMQKIGIDINLFNNYPWIYIQSINGNPITEKFHADYGFTIVFLPVRCGEDLEFTDIGEIFKLIRKYK